MKIIIPCLVTCDGKDGEEKCTEQCIINRTGPLPDGWERRSDLTPERHLCPKHNGQEINLEPTSVEMLNLPAVLELRTMAKQVAKHANRVRTIKSVTVPVDELRKLERLAKDITQPM